MASRTSKPPKKTPTVSGKQKRYKVGEPNADAETNVPCPIVSLEQTAMEVQGALLNSEGDPHKETHAALVEVAKFAIGELDIELTAWLGKCTKAFAEAEETGLCRKGMVPVSIAASKRAHAMIPDDTKGRCRA